jgi:hypothetical protein
MQDLGDTGCVGLSEIATPSDSDRSTLQNFYGKPGFPVCVARLTGNRPRWMRRDIEHWIARRVFPARTPDEDRHLIMDAADVAGLVAVTRDVFIRRSPTSNHGSRHSPEASARTTSG